VVVAPVPTQPGWPASWFNQASKPPLVVLIDTAATMSRAKGSPPSKLAEAMALIVRELLPE
jgi:hypothetical protein